MINLSHLHTGRDVDIYKNIFAALRHAQLVCSKPKSWRACGLAIDQHKQTYIISRTVSGEAHKMITKRAKS